MAVNKDDFYYEYLKSRSSLGDFYRKYFLYPKLKKYLSGKVLDIGCGIGDYLRFDKNALGVDINPNTVKYCKDLGLDARLMDPNILPFENETYESVMLDNVMEHIIEPTDLLKEVHRVLKVNGNVVIGVPGEKGYAHDPDHKVFYDSEKLELLLAKHNFKTASIFYMPLRSNFLNKKIRQYCLYMHFTKLP